MELSWKKGKKKTNLNSKSRNKFQWRIFFTKFFKFRFFFFFWSIFEFSFNFHRFSEFSIFFLLNFHINQNNEFHRGISDISPKISNKIHFFVIYSKSFSLQIKQLIKCAGYFKNATVILARSIWKYVLKIHGKGTVMVDVFWAWLCVCFGVWKQGENECFDVFHVQTEWTATVISAVFNRHK